MLWSNICQCYLWEDDATSLVILCRGRQERLADYPEVDNDCVQHEELRSRSRKQISPATGKLVREKDVDHAGSVQTIHGRNEKTIHLRLF